jgi:hypothetical protein
VPELSFLRVPQVKAALPGKSRPSRSGGLYLRGPVPLAWLSRACALGSGETLAVALALCDLAGLRGRMDDLDLCKEALRHFRVGPRSAKSRALQKLKAEGLVKVVGSRGKRPLVSVPGAAGLAGISGPVEGEFLRGPVPLAWLGAACGLPGEKVLATALAVWFLRGLEPRAASWKLTRRRAERFHVKREAKYDALAALEEAGLVEVVRRGTSSAVVAIREAPVSA